VINPVKHPDLIIRKLGIDETRFWVSDGNKKIQDIHSEHAVVICNPNTTQAQYLLNRIKKMGIVFKRTISTESIAVAAKLTAHGGGVGILPTRAVKSLYYKELKPLLKLPTHSDELCLIYRNENRNIKAIQAIVKAIKDHSSPN
jgi:DNA-binding transcriptional LysR family regulator